MDKLEIRYAEASAGWLNFSIRLGKYFRNFSATHLADPFPEMCTWLTSLVEGKRTGEINIYEEGSGCRVGFEMLADHIYGISLSSYAEKAVGKEEIYEVLSGEVTAFEIVDGFYANLMVFSQSSEYDKRQWEYVEFGEALMDLLKLPTMEACIERILDYNRFELMEVIWAAHPEKIVDKESNFFNDSIVFPDRYIFNLAEKRKHECKEVHAKALVSIQIPEDYDDMAAENRRNILSEEMLTHLPGWYGEKLLRLKNTTLDNWLLQNSPTNVA